MLATATVVEWATLVGAIGGAVSAILAALNARRASHHSEDVKEKVENGQTGR